MTKIAYNFSIQIFISILFLNKMQHIVCQNEGMILCYQANTIKLHKLEMTIPCDFFHPVKSLLNGVDTRCHKGKQNQAVQTCHCTQFFNYSEIGKHSRSKQIIFFQHINALDRSGLSITYIYFCFVLHHILHHTLYLIFPLHEALVILHSGNNDVAM
jgi:hypothetical protein